MAEEPNENDFATEVSGARSSFLEEYAAFLRANKKWWITPIVISILILGVLVVLGGTAAAPFIYTLF